MLSLSDVYVSENFDQKYVKNTCILLSTVLKINFASPGQKEF